MEIHELIDFPQDIPVVMDWMAKEWPSTATPQAREFRVCGHKKRGQLPCALVAREAGSPVGVISLVLYEKGIQEGRPHWVDAVWVLPQFRGKGLAHRLLAAAEEKARSLQLDRLYALTEIPNFYLKAGWEIAVGVAGNSPGDFVMNKNLQMLS